MQVLEVQQEVLSKDTLWFIMSISGGVGGLVLVVMV